MLEARTHDSCGPSGCEAHPLRAERIEVAADPAALYELSRREGFGDGLPVLPPTEGAVRALLAETPYAPDAVIGLLPPQMAPATVEAAAVNAAMAGCAPEAFPVVVAALEAICVPEHNLASLVATTSSVTPMFVVNGPRRAELGFDMQAGCMGGAGGRGSSTVGRAVQLCLRNVGGQLVGVTSKSVFGQPARSVGLCFAEWEERSPWPSLAEQRGHAATDEVVTAHGGKGTFPIADVHNDDPRDLLRLVAKSIAFPLSNELLAPTGAQGQMVLVVNPVWARRFGDAFPRIPDLQAFLWEHAWQPADLWPAGNRAYLEAHGRVDPDGRVHVVDRPDQLVVVVAGGEGGLHAICLPSWGESEMQSQVVARPA